MYRDLIFIQDVDQFKKEMEIEMETDLFDMSPDEIYQFLFELISPIYPEGDFKERKDPPWGEVDDVFEVRPGMFLSLNSNLDYMGLTEYIYD